MPVNKGHRNPGLPILHYFIFLHGIYNGFDLERLLICFRFSETRELLSSSCMFLWLPFVNLLVLLCFLHISCLCSIRICVSILISVLLQGFCVFLLKFLFVLLLLAQGDLMISAENCNIIYVEEIVLLS